jgi:hypothetical protein
MQTFKLIKSSKLAIKKTENVYLLGIIPQIPNSMEIGRRMQHADSDSGAGLEIKIKHETSAHTFIDG